MSGVVAASKSRAPGGGTAGRRRRSRRPSSGLGSPRRASSRARRTRSCPQSRFESFSQRCPFDGPPGGEVEERDLVRVDGERLARLEEPEAEERRRRRAAGKAADDRDRRPDREERAPRGGRAARRCCSCSRRSRGRRTPGGRRKTSAPNPDFARRAEDERPRRGGAPRGNRATTSRGTPRGSRRGSRRRRPRRGRRSRPPPRRFCSAMPARPAA